jgi:drug/metabolite transporter (DMT)-like permease
MLLRIAPVLFVLLWSTGFIASKVGGEHAEPFTFLAIRFSLATVLLAPLMLFGERPSARAALDAALTGALIHTAYIGGVMWALRLGMPAGVVAIIVCLQPLLTSLLAGPLLGERIDRRHWMGIALGLAGAVLVLAPKMALAGGIDTVPAAPISLLAVIGAVAALIGITTGTLYQKAHGTTGDLPKLAFYQYVGAASVAAILSLATETRAVDWSTEFFMALAWLVVVLSLGAIGLLLMMIRASAVSRVTSLFYLVPVTTAVFAWALFGEQLTAVQGVGMVLVMLAVAMIGGRRRV